LNPLQPKSVLIAGCGYLGLRAARLWIAQGIPVSAITRSSQKARQLIAEGITPIEFDLSRPSSNDNPITLPPADVILWSVGFDRSAGVSRDAIWIDGLKRLISGIAGSEITSSGIAASATQNSGNAAVRGPRQFVYVSSTSVYGNAEGNVVDESTAPDPTAEGGRACWQAEQFLREQMSDQFPECEVVVLRMAGIYGPNRLLRRIEDLQNRVPLSSPPNDWLNLIHVDDAASAVVTVSACRQVPPVLNIVNSGTLTRQEYYSELSRLVSSPPPVFAEDQSAAAESPRGRNRSGNKQVISRHRSQFSLEMQFDDVRLGLRQAVVGTGGISG
jgi:nucleoside-diphosphate-sugar epimerase